MRIYKKKYTTESERKAARIASTLRSRAKRSKEDYNGYMKEYNRKKYPELRNAVIDLLGGQCKLCNYRTDRRALQIDHIDGTGRAERRRIGWHRFYNKILSDQTNYQLLCANCNYVKRYDNNEVYFVDENLKSDGRING